MLYKSANLLLSLDTGRWSAETKAKPKVYRLIWPKKRERKTWWPKWHNTIKFSDKQYFNHYVTCATIFLIFDRNFSHWGNRLELLALDCPKKPFKIIWEQELSLHRQRVPILKSLHAWIRMSIYASYARYYFILWHRIKMSSDYVYC